MIRDYIFVDDVVNANILAIYNPNFKNQIFNISTGTETTTLQWLKAISKICCKEIDFSIVPARKGEISKSCLSIEKAKNLLNWIPSTNIENNLSITINHFIK